MSRTLQTSFISRWKCSRFDEVNADGVAHEVDDGTEPEFAKEIGAMALDRLEANAERDGNLLARFAFGDLAHDLDFARGELSAAVVTEMEMRISGRAVQRLHSRRRNRRKTFSERRGCYSASDNQRKLFVLAGSWKQPVNRPFTRESVWGAPQMPVRLAPMVILGAEGALA